MAHKCIFFGVGMLALAACVVACGEDSSAGGAGGSAGSAGSAGSGDGSAGNAGAAGSDGSAGAGPCILGSSWELVDDYLHSPGEPTNIVGITGDARGNVYAVGLARQSGTVTGIVRKSSDGGKSWANVNWGQGAPNDAAADDAGNVYVIAGLNGRVLRKSSDGGASFIDATVIPMSGGANDPCNTGFVAAGPNGVVAVGASCDSTGWVVRKSTDSGMTWQPAFSFQLAPGKAARMQDVGVDPNGEVYATGNALDANDTSHWLTIREGAATGIVSDDFQLATGSNAQGNGFVTKGTPLVAGFASDGATIYGVVRRRTGSNIWQTIDQFATRASDIEAVGEQIIAAGTLDDNGISRVVTRQSDDSGTSWKPIDEYAYVPGRGSFSGALTSDARGNVYGAITGRDAGDVPHWLVRKLSCRLD